MFQFSCRFAF